MILAKYKACVVVLVYLQMPIDHLNDLKPMIKNNFQTLTYFGISKRIKQMIKKNGLLVLIE